MAYEIQSDWIVPDLSALKPINDSMRKKEQTPIKGKDWQIMASKSYMLYRKGFCD